MMQSKIAGSVQAPVGVLLDGMVEVVVLEKTIP